MSYRYWFLLLVFASSAFGQTKVGTTGAQFLEITPSARSAGMGGLGVMLTGPYSYWHNPAALSLVEMRNGSLSFSPVAIEPEGSDAEFRAYSLSARLTSQSSSKQARWIVSIALSRVQLNSGDMVERTYGQGTLSGTSSTYSYDDYCDQISAALAYSHKVEIALGFSRKLIRSEVADYSATGDAIDFGGIIRVPVYGTQSERELASPRYSHSVIIGGSFQNVGPDMTFIERSYPLPLKRTIGVGWEFKYLNRGRATLEVTPAVEYWGGRDSELMQRLQAGIEIGLMESIYGRAGGLFGSVEDRATFGLGLSSERLRMKATSGGGVSFFKYLRQNLIVRFDFGRMLPTDLRDATNSYTLTITL